MFILNTSRCAIGLLGLVGATACFSADAVLDLKRVVPVPANEQIPVMDFFRPKVLAQPVLNSSGTHVAAIVTAGEDKHRLMVMDLKARKYDMIGASGDKDVYQVHWLDDTRLVYSFSTDKLYALALMAADIGSLQRSYPLQQYNGSRLISVPLKNRLYPLVWNRSNIENQRDDGVAAIDSSLNSGLLADLSAAGAEHEDFVAVRDNNDRHITTSYAKPPSGITYGYLADKEGELAYCFTSKNGNLAMYRLVDKNWVACPVNLENIDIEGAGNEPGEVLVTGPRQEGKPRALQLLNSTTGQLGEVVLQDEAYDFEGWLYRNPGTGDVLGAVFQRNGPRVVWFNEQYGALQKILDGFFPGLVVRILNSDIKHKIFLVAVSSDKQPASYNWVDLEARKAGLIRSSAPWIDPQRMQAMNILKFKTRDGRQLDAYLTLPAGATKANPPPLVVLPHGGPWVRDSWGYDGEVQFLASRGYAVLQPNYRGSTGYGWMFPVEDEWDFRKMHDDVTDAAKVVIASGLIDRSRVAIMGASFGGYLALSGVVNEPGLYRCAVSNAGVFDWELLLKSKKDDRYSSPTYDRLMRRLGDPKLQQEKFSAISPLRHVDQIRVPVFVAGGKEDQTVEIQQSRRLVSELEKHHIPFEKFLVGGEGHGMSHLKNEVELYTRIEAFLDKYLKPVQPVASVR